MVCVSFYLMEGLPEVIYNYSKWRQIAPAGPMSSEYYRKAFFSELSFLLVATVLGISVFAALGRKSAPAAEQ